MKSTNAVFRSIIGILIVLSLVTPLSAQTTGGGIGGFTTGGGGGGGGSTGGTTGGTTGGSTGGGSTGGTSTGGNTGGTSDNSGEGTGAYSTRESGTDAAWRIRLEIREHKRELERQREAAREAEAQKPAPQRQTTPRKPRRTTPARVATRTPPPLPQSRPVFVAGIPNPFTRPLRTLGRPALLDAEIRDNTVVALVSLDDPDAATGIAEQYGLELLEVADISILKAGVAKFSVPDDQSVAEATAMLIADARTIGAHPNYVFDLQQSEPAKAVSPLLELQYAPRRMAIDRAHAISRGTNVVVAVIDTGVETNHGELAGRPIRIFDAVSGDGTATEPHGTAIAGLIGAGGNMVGIAPDVSLLAVRAFAQADDGRFLSDSYTIARAIDWAVINGADILNMSFAGPADPLILKLLDELGNRNIVSIAAAGNYGAEAPAAYPAAHPATIAVTATDASDALYVNANRGIYVTVAAPGVDVIAPAPGNTYELVSGTSIATAHMSGIVALMLSRKRDITRDDLIRVLGDSAQDFGAPGADPEFGLGLVDAFRATSAIIESVQSTTTASN